MAGDWIAWCKGLARKPEVLAIGKAVRKGRREVAATLMEFWEWADEQTEDGSIPNVALTDLADMIAGTSDKFWQAVVSVGWLTANDSGIVIPHFQRWLGESAKKRINKNSRQARWRSPGKAADDLYGGQSVDTGSSTGVDDPVSTDVDDGGKPKAPTREPERTYSGVAAQLRAAEPPALANGTPATDYQRAVSTFMDAWKAKYGERYSFRGKDGDSVKWMLGEVKGDLVRWGRIVTDYLGSDDQFLVKKRHDLGTLCGQFNTWKGAAPAVPMTEEERKAKWERDQEAWRNRPYVPG
jgi:hypothetical protein